MQGRQVGDLERRPACHANRRSVARCWGNSLGSLTSGDVRGGRDPRVHAGAPSPRRLAATPGPAHRRTCGGGVAIPALLEANVASSRFSRRPAARARRGANREHAGGRCTGSRRSRATPTCGGPAVVYSPSVLPDGTPSRYPQGYAQGGPAPTRLRGPLATRSIMPGRCRHDIDHHPNLHAIWISFDRGGSCRRRQPVGQASHRDGSRIWHRRRDGDAP